MIDIKDAKELISGLILNPGRIDSIHFCSKLIIEFEIDNSIDNLILSSDLIRLYDLSYIYNNTSMGFTNKRDIKRRIWSLGSYNCLFEIYNFILIKKTDIELQETVLGFLRKYVNNESFQRGRRVSLENGQLLYGIGFSFSFNKGIDYDNLTMYHDYLDYIISIWVDYINHLIKDYIKKDFDKGVGIRG